MYEQPLVGVLQNFKFILAAAYFGGGRPSHKLCKSKLSVLVGLLKLLEDLRLLAIGTDFRSLFTGDFHVAVSLEEGIFVFGHANTSFNLIIGHISADMLLTNLSSPVDSTEKLPWQLRLMK